MSTQQTSPNVGPQTILVTADYQASVSDRNLCVQKAGVTVTLPQNAVVGQTSIEFVASEAFQLTAGLAGPPLSPTDPLLVAKDQGFILALGSDGWQKVGAAPVPVTTSGTRKNLPEATLVPLFSVDMTHVPDNSFGCQIQFAVECTDGSDVQIRQGTANAAVAVKGGVFTTPTPSVNQSNAFTNGASTLTTAFSWSTSGNVATLNMTMTSSLVVTEGHINFSIPFASHPEAITLL